MPAAVIDFIKESKIQTTTGEQTLDLAIEQGATFNYPFRLAGNWTTGSFRGKIRNDYAEFDLDENGDLNPELANFTFLGITYDAVEDKTLVIVSLGSTVTAILKATVNVPNPRRSVKNQGYRVYDIEYEDAGIVTRIQQGLLEVTPESTET